jgi:hypothetical protein
MEANSRAETRLRSLPRADGRLLFPSWRADNSRTAMEEWRVIQIVNVDGIQERLYRMYRIRVQVTINDGRYRAGVPIFGHPAPEMIIDSPAVLNRIKHLKSEAQLP